MTEVNHNANDGGRGHGNNDRGHDGGSNNNGNRGNGDHGQHGRPPEPPGHVIHPRPTHGELPARARLRHSADAMTEHFPTFKYTEQVGPSGPIGVWTGAVRPISSSDGVRLLLDDLAHDRPVYSVGGELRHLSACQANHCEHPWMADAGPQLQRTFGLKIVWTGTEALPRAYVLAPVIPPNKRKHMWSDGAICAFLASDRVWRWQANTVADFVPHIVVWLVKWMIFDQTGAWIGAEHDNSPQYHLALVHPKDPCWCGMGQQYRRCHRGDDLIAVGIAQPRRMRH